MLTIEIRFDNEKFIYFIKKSTITYITSSLGGGFMGIFPHTQEVELLQKPVFESEQHQNHKQEDWFVPGWFGMRMQDFKFQVERS